MCISGEPNRARPMRAQGGPQGPGPQGLGPQGRRGSTRAQGGPPEPGPQGPSPQGHKGVHQGPGGPTRGRPTRAPSQQGPEVRPSPPPLDSKPDPLICCWRCGMNCSLDGNSLPWVIESLADW